MAQTIESEINTVSPGVRKEQKTSAIPGPGRRISRKKATVTFGLMAGAVLLTLAGLYFFAQSQIYQSTDDAFIGGHVINVAPKIAGTVAQVLVNDNQEVKKGQLLVRIDPRDYQAALRQKQAARDSTKAQAAAVEATVQQQIAHVATLEATVASDQATADADLAMAEKASKDLIRFQQLFTQKVVSPQDLDTSKATADSAKATHEAAVKKVASDKAQVAEAHAEVNAFIAGYRSVEAQIHESDANVQTAELNHSYTDIFAPENGRVTNKAVQPGNYIQVGQSLMALVPDHVFVLANFKENQIGLMRPGQPAEIEIDALSSRKFQGHVDSIMAGSGAAFSLLPPENATGNYVKVVQRVPVKIEFDRPVADAAAIARVNGVKPIDVGIPLGPGESVVPTVKVQNYGFSMTSLVVIAIVLAFVLFLIYRWGTKPPKEKPAK